MAPRPRSRKNAGLPPNLYEQRGYYTYRNPQTGEKIGIGRNKASAVTQAVEANLHFMGLAVSLLDKITGRASKTVKDWCDEHGTTARCIYIKRDLGDYVIANLTPLIIADWLKQWDTKIRMRQAMLSAIKIELNRAIGKGWITTNPADKLETPTPQTMRERLSLGAYKAIYAKADPWLQRAMEIALMTAIRRENVISAKWADIHDGHFHVEHVKGTKDNPAMKVRYPLDMYLPEMNWTLEEVLKRCRDSTVSQYLIHHPKSQGKAKAGDPIRDKTIEQLFRDAREDAGVDGEHPPTFHEIKSLAIRLWEAHGVNVKTMAGHKTDAMSALYKDTRGAEWVTVGKK